MSTIQLYAKKFPILLQISSPKGEVELIETIGKGNYGYVYKVTFVQNFRYSLIFKGTAVENR